MGETLTLTPALVNAYTTLMVDPACKNLPFRPLAECFEVSETVTPKHRLAADYITCEVPQCPKVIFYIVMQDKYGDKMGKAASGEEGYYLKFKTVENAY